MTLAHPFGIAEIYVGTVTGTRIDLDSNVLIRTSTAREVTRSVRLYGIVEGDLAYAIDMEARASRCSRTCPPGSTGCPGSSRRHRVDRDQPDQPLR